jgi:hypothetical protein
MEFAVAPKRFVLSMHVVCLNAKGKTVETTAVEACVAYAETIKSAMRN